MGETKKYYWLKLKTDFFFSKEIKKLRKIAGGDTYTVIYLKMLLMSVKTDGKIYYEGVEETFAEELALSLDEDADNVLVVLNFLERHKLIEQGGDAEYFLPEAALAIGSETQGAERVRKFREKQKALQCNTDVTLVKRLGNTEIEREKEKIREDKEIEEDVDSTTQRLAQESTIVGDVVMEYNRICKSLPEVRAITDKRKKAIKARWKENGKSLEFFIDYFQRVEDSNFLSGRSGKDWKANFDWIMNPTNMAKVLEGNYDNKQTAQQSIDIWGNALTNLYGGE